MPTYEYECDKCGKVVELFQPITQAVRKKLRKSDPKPCDCNATVTRLIGTGAGVIFRGSGFYHTDYRSESYKKAAKADSDAATKKSDGSDKKSETKKADSSTKETKSKAGKED